MYDINNALLNGALIGKLFFSRAPNLCGFGKESLVFVHEHQNFSSLATVISNTMFQNANEIELGLCTFVLYVEQRC
jgi:hypothetical protein